jgi:hypothetical protein
VRRSERADIQLQGVQQALSSRRWPAAKHVNCN